ncbi:MAG: hypothetical protein H6922_04920 [Pseudomonadaceae bacterium]|nr:hypothetical protein [Pseudomonadaceae bacterium]
MIFKFFQKAAHATSLGCASQAMWAMDMFLKEHEGVDVIEMMSVGNSVNLIHNTLGNMGEPIEGEEVIELLMNPDEPNLFILSATATVNRMVRDARSFKGHPNFFALQFGAAFFSIISTPKGFSGRQERWSKLNSYFVALYNKHAEVLSSFSKKAS